MPTTQQYPTGNGSPAGWSGSPGSLSSDDGDSSFMNTTSTPNPHRFTFANLPADASLINSCAIAAKFRNDGAGIATGYIYNGASDILVYQVSGVTTYSLVSTTHSSSTVAGINAASIGLNAAQSGNINLRCTLYYRLTDYQLAGGMLTFWLPLFAALGSSILLSDIPKMNEEMWRLHHTRLNPSEISLAYQALKDHRFPTYHFLGDSYGA